MTPRHRKRIFRRPDEKKAAASKFTTVRQLFYLRPSPSHPYEEMAVLFIFRSYADNVCLPFNLLEAKTFLPPCVLILALNP